jgi:hypothetical protein
MINKPIDNRRDKCTNISSECVIWDGPDIPCLDLCYGDSIEKVVYEQAIALCNLIEQLKPQGLDFSCLLTDTSCKPKDINELLQFILNKICEVIDSIPKPFTCEDAFKCKVRFTMCSTRDCEGNDTAANTIELPLYTTDGQTDNFIKFIVEKICDLYCKINRIEQQVSSINTQLTSIWQIIQNIQETISSNDIVSGNLPVCGSETGQSVTNWGDLYGWLTQLGQKVYGILQFIYGGCNPTIPSAINEPCTVGEYSFTFTANNLIQFWNVFKQYYTWLCQRLNGFNTFISNVNTQITNINTQLAECNCGCPKDIFEIIPNFEFDSNSERYIINKYKLVSALPISASFVYNTSLGHGASYIDLDGNPQVLTIGSDIIISGNTIIVNKCPNSSFYAGKCYEYNMSTELALYIGVQYTYGSNTCNVSILKKFQVKHCVCGYVENLQVDEIINLYTQPYINS